MKSFKGAELAPEQKFQIGLRIAMNMCTLNRAEEITQLERKKLIMWTFKAKNDKSFAEKRGRPPLVNEDLCKEMLDAVTLCDNRESCHANGSIEEVGPREALGRRH